VGRVTIEEDASTASNSNCFILRTTLKKRKRRRTKTGIETANKRQYPKGGAFLSSGVTTKEGKVSGDCAKNETRPEYVSLQREIIS